MREGGKRRRKRGGRTSTTCDVTRKCCKSGRGGKKKCHNKLTTPTPAQTSSRNRLQYDEGTYRFLAWRRRRKRKERGKGERARGRKEGRKKHLGPSAVRGRDCGEGVGGGGGVGAFLHFPLLIDCVALLLLLDLAFVRSGIEGESGGPTTIEDDATADRPQWRKLAFSPPPPHLPPSLFSSVR